MVKMNTKTSPGDDPFADIVSSFRGSVGEGEYCSIKLFKRNDKTLKLEYIDNFPVQGGNFELFIQQLRSDFRRGGDFKLTLIDGDGKTLDNKALVLADLEPATTSTRTANDDRGGRSNDNQLMIAMMNNNQQANQQMTALIMSMMQTNSQNMMQMITALIPAIAGQRESASDLLSKVTAIQKDLALPANTNGMEQFKDMLLIARELVGEGGNAGGDDALSAMARAAAPIIETLSKNMPQAQAQQAPAAQPVYTMRPVHMPIQRPPAGPGPGPDQAMHMPDQSDQVAGQVHAGDDLAAAQAAQIEKYKPIMGQIAKLLDRDYDADDLVGFIVTQIDLGAVDGGDIEQLFRDATAAPDNLPLGLFLFGIVEPGHVETVRQAIAIFLSELDADDEVEGREGDTGSPGPDEPIRKARGGKPKSQINGAVAN